MCSNFAHVFPVRRPELGSNTHKQLFVPPLSRMIPGIVFVEFFCLREKKSHFRELPQDMTCPRLTAILPEQQLMQHCNNTAGLAGSWSTSPRQAPTVVIVTKVNLRSNLQARSPYK